MSAALAAAGRPSARTAAAVRARIDISGLRAGVRLPAG
jgi:hypothetical protein